MKRGVEKASYSVHFFERTFCVCSLFFDLSMDVADLKETDWKELRNDILDRDLSVFTILSKLFLNKTPQAIELLCTRLYAAPPSEIEFLLPQLWYA